MSKLLCNVLKKTGGASTPLIARLVPANKILH